MGSNTRTANEVIRAEQAKLARFRRVLRRVDQQLLDQLFAYASRHATAISAAEHLLDFESMLLTICLEQQRQINSLLERLEREPPS